MEEHQRSGHHVVFITGCPEFLIAPLAKFLGVETMFCAQPDLDETGAYACTSIHADVLVQRPIEPLLSRRCVGRW